MLKELLRNPYRILGVYSNSPKKEQIANKGKMQAFLRVKKSMPFHLDLKGLLPEIQRTQELVDYADSELALSPGQIKHAQFWFINKTSIDKIAFNHLIDGNIDSAMNFWKKSSNFSSLQNLFVCYLIREDYKTAIVKCAIPLYNQYANDFVSAIDKSSTVSSDTLIQTVVDMLSDDDVDLLPISDGITDKTWKSYIEAKKVDPLISKLNGLVSEAKAAKGKGASARLNAGNKLKIASKPLLSTLLNILSKADTRYQMIADKVAQEVLQCSIDYYNDSKDVDSPVKALPLCEYASSVAVGNAAKQRCEQNYDVIKDAFDNMPPSEVVPESKEINELLSWYAKQQKTSKKGLELLKKSRNSLISIKEKLGRKHKYYLETSSILGSAALNGVIDEVNDVQKDDKSNPFEGIFGGSSKYSIYSDILGSQERRRQKAYAIKDALHNAWQTIVYIDLLDKTEDFNKDRYQPNRKTLFSIIDGLKGFGAPDSNYIIKGCAYGISADKKFFWSDSEHFDSCSSKHDYENYLQMFPSGKHIEKAEQRLALIKKKEKKIIKYILIAAVIAIILFILIISSNAKGNSSGNTTSTSSSALYDSNISNDTNENEDQVDNAFIEESNVEESNNEETYVDDSYIEDDLFVEDDEDSYDEDYEDDFDSDYYYDDDF